MKLIDLLVQELPKRGGWPGSMHALAQSRLGTIYKAGGGFPILNCEKAEDCELAEVTRAQYEAALAASQKVEWNGEGLPPLGCECEWLDKNTQKWFPVLIKYQSSWVIVIQEIKDGEEDPVELSIDVLTDKERCKFRPIHSEADKKREIGVTALALAMGGPPFIYGQRMNDGRLVAYGVYELYDKIAAGEVAGIRIE